MGLAVGPEYQGEPFIQCHKPSPKSHFFMGSALAHQDHLIYF